MAFRASPHLFFYFGVLIKIQSTLRDDLERKTFAYVIAGGIVSEAEFK